MMAGAAGFPMTKAEQIFLGNFLFPSATGTSLLLLRGVSGPVK